MNFILQLDLGLRKIQGLTKLHAGFISIDGAGQLDNPLKVLVVSPDEDVSTYETFLNMWMFLISITSDVSPVFLNRMMWMFQDPNKDDVYDRDGDSETCFHHHNST